MGIGPGFPQAGRYVQHPDLRNLRLLCLGGERRGEEAASQGADEGPPIHHSIT
jgi:hypothetical protein